MPKIKLVHVDLPTHGATVALASAQYLPLKNGNGEDAELAVEVGRAMRAAGAKRARDAVDDFTKRQQVERLDPYLAEWDDLLLALDDEARVEVKISPAAFKWLKARVAEWRASPAGQQQSAAWATCSLRLDRALEKATEIEAEVQG